MEDEAEVAAPKASTSRATTARPARQARIPPTAVEGEYAAGDYGEAGVAGAAVVGDVEGDYPEGDYGEGGVSGEPPAAAEEGEYPEGDYGTAGTSRPQQADRPAAGESATTTTPRGAATSAKGDQPARAPAGRGALA